MKKVDALQKKLVADREVRAAYAELAPEFALARELIRARTTAGLSQTDLAERMGTTQSAVARMESGAQLPSMRTLIRYAAATGTQATVRLVKKDGARKTHAKTRAAA